MTQETIFLAVFLTGAIISGRLFFRLEEETWDEGADSRFEFWLQVLGVSIMWIGTLPIMLVIIARKQK